MRILVTRPLKEARRTARRLAELGHEAVLAPVTMIAALRTPPPPGPFAAVVATSARAFDARPALIDAPIWVVGARTGAAAVAAGWPAPAHIAADVSALAAWIGRRPSSGGRLLYLAGRARKPDLERALAALGHAVNVVETYAAVAADALPEDVIAAARSIDAALHYSRRSAEIFCDLAQRAGMGATARAWRHFCLSPDVAAGLDALAPIGRVCAPAPIEAALLALVKE